MNTRLATTPAASAAPAQATLDGPSVVIATHSPSKPIRVIALDDDSVDIEALRRCLRSITTMTFELIGCCEVADASRLLRTESFDVLFVDYYMHATTGLDTLSRLREEGCRVPAILLTGSHGEHILHEALRAGVIDYVPKDHLSAPLIEQAIRSALAKAKLNARIEGKQLELERTIESLRRRGEEIESFYHSVSHELKTPLTGAREFVSLVHDGVAGDLTDAQTQLLAAAIRNCDQMTHCVNDMLDAARIETGKLVLMKEDCDLSAVLRDALDSVRSSARAKDIEFVVRGIDSPLPAHLDPHRIYQVVANLASNAIKFTPSHGRVEVHVEAQPEGHIEVRVADSGPGLPQGDEHRVFERLYQSHKKDGAILGGLGMGLYISREIVELHEGQVRYSPSSLGGAQFAFRLPTQSKPHPPLLAA